jgi:hypothetical protein
VIKLFKNRKAMTFPDVDAVTPDLEVKDAVKSFVSRTLRLSVPASKWRNTAEVTVFLANEDLDGEDEMLHVSAIRFFGTMPSSISTADLKPAGMPGFG